MLPLSPSWYKEFLWGGPAVPNLFSVLLDVGEVPSFYHNLYTPILTQDARSHNTDVHATIQTPTRKAFARRVDRFGLEDVFQRGFISFYHE
jgi:hypothetical protein